MENMINLRLLIGIAAIVIGFLLRFNPVLVVIVIRDNNGYGGAYACRRYP